MALVVAFETPGEFVAVSIPSSTDAPELRVYSTIGVQGALQELIARFEKASGRRLSVTWGTAPMLVKRLQGGGPPM